ncbi:hypothetical protein L1987_41213 [Smallanthus sonchifolius]|uniref:Uncharacterized protein n=1 Tax=Smallanthus sonchifolius TaxID=185202 RepID=A0ACB9GU18_9ASTR|nr:hypothetical protein L1987_41213 [Smallanthus sonchifolius]
MSWDWKKYTATVQETADLVNCFRMVAGTILNSHNDLWIWNNNELQHLSVQDTKVWINSCNSEEVYKTVRWCKWLPAKCNIFMWRSCLDRIPTKVALRRRNIAAGDCKCVLCEDAEETVDHLFTECRFTDGVWSGIARWCHLPPIFLFSVQDVQDIVDQLGCSSRKKETIFGILVLTCWRMWKARNEKVFKATNVKIIQVISDVKSLSFLWYNSRGKSDRVDWKGWQSFNFNVM